MRVLGVDGGGTKTLAVLVDRGGAVRGFAAGPATNPLNEPRWRERLAAVARAALAGSIHPLAGAAFGLPAFGEVAALSHEQLAAARDVFPGASVRNDVHAAHEGAFAGGPGVLLLAGTGSMCWARDAAGRMERIGGWGDGFGDEGSAHWIGHAALARVSQIMDGRRAGADFVDRLLAAIDTTRAALPDALLRWFYDHPDRRPAVAALAAAVDAMAGHDAVADGIIDEAADALALHVTTARRRLDLGPREPWCFVGGVSRSAAMRQRLAARLGSAPMPPLLPPVGGAAWRAATDAGWAPDAAWITRVSAEITQRLETT